MSLGSPSASASSSSLSCPGSRLPVERYIEESWSFLERSQRHLVEAAADPKLGERERYPVFLAAGENLQAVRHRLLSALGPEALQGIELRSLPPDIKQRPQLEGGIEAHGLLYLPHPYVVPGGRFNEMYGWDSHFINLGLLASGRVEQARNMVENHLYQVRHYGRVLNANRTYYLTRSQPPFLATMVADVHRHTGDGAWVRDAIPALEETHRFWTAEPHLTAQTGLSRYYDLGHGPADEVVASEKDEAGHTHYDRIQQEFRKLSTLPPEQREVCLGYPLELYYDAARDRLTDLFFVGDRSMRESGYDPSDRFGRFNVDVPFYNPVDLNSLLYAFELEMGRLCGIAGHPEQTPEWLDRAWRRADAMHRYLWDSAAGMFLDYNVRTLRRRDYPFATAFFPLWTGWASPAQAAAVHDSLAEFLKPGGLITSLQVSGNQWDAPFGWAPLQLAAVEGLARYGYHRAADQVAAAFVSLVEQEYERSGTIVEKYDVVACTADVSEGIAFGYSTNEIGFGWTNGVYLLLKRRLAEVGR
jgi:alpha,alpha-trehalase